MGRLGFNKTLIGNTEVIFPPTSLIEKGPFLMGSDPITDPYTNRFYEIPQHEVNLDTFYITKFPITVAEYECAVHTKAVKIPEARFDITWEKQQKNRTSPVVCVSWQDALDYCTWLNTLCDSHWRLPTEAEWEKAARGRDGRIYPWGNEWDIHKANTNESSFHRIVSISRYVENLSPYGVRGMSGNTWEWCQSLEKPYPYNAEDGRENLEIMGRRVLRGGSWADEFEFARCANRYSDEQDFPLSHAGFRLVCNVSPILLANSES